MTDSPYAKVRLERWSEVTDSLIKKFPLSRDRIVEAVQRSWDDFYASRIGGDGLHLGEDFFLPAQATGVILEKLISHELAKSTGNWRSGLLPVPWTPS